MITPVIALTVGHRPRLGTGRFRVIVVVAAAAAVVVAASQLLDSTLFPVSGSVDVAHHLQLVQWIADHGGVPSHPTENLESMWAYPFGIHAIAALTSRVLGMDPIRAMNLAGFASLAMLAAALTALGAALADSVVRKVSRPILWAGSLVAVVGLLLGHQFFVDLLTRDYFLAQAFGMYLLVVSLLFAVEAPHDERFVWLSALSGAALVFAYPLFVPVLAVSLLPIAVARWRTVGGRGAIRWTVLVSVPTVLAGIVYLPGRTGAGQEILNNEGAIAPVTFDALGGSPLVVLMVVGTALIISVFLLRRQWALLAVPAGIVAAVIGRAALERLSAEDFGSKYQATKYLHVAWLLGLSTAPIAVVAALNALASRWALIAASIRRSGFVAAAACGLLIFVGFGPRYNTRTPVLPQSEYEAALWARENMTVDRIDVAEQGVGPYLIWMVVFGRPFEQSFAYLGPPADNVAAWLQGTGPYLLLSNAAELAQVTASGTQIRVVHQVDTSMIIERIPGS
jgi:hypothetical protein